ncbi:kinectin-like [Actinia tenebrosa]|uniref:Kinectin-like n=1 Tax=Actinia tenebrosa TaxID=6105 RepID=A0A6P8I254_ACTTE|nr:kinectin-like [Actinia tenebrosa]
MTKKNKDDIEGSDRVVKETFDQAKQKFERLREMNKEMMLLSRQGKDVSELEKEKNELQEELLMYKRMAVQQKMGSISKSRRKSLLKKDESLQWKLVAGEMLDIVKCIKLEGKTDKVQLEKDLNMIILAMGGLNEQIEKLKIELSASEAKVKKLQEEKTNLQQQNTMKEQELKDKILEMKNCRKLIKKLEEEKKQETEKALVKEQEEDKAKAKEEEFKRPDTFDDIMQAQLRDQKNKALKLEEQNKELLAQIESYKQEEQARKETESNLAQMLSIPGMADCSTCQLLGRQVLTSREEITLLTSKVEELEQQLAELREQLTQAQEELENAMKSQVDVIKRTEFIEGQEATSGTPSPTQEVSPESPEIKIESPKPEKHKKAGKPVRKSKLKKETDSKRKSKEAKRKVTEAKTSDGPSKAASEEESKSSEEEIQETEEGKDIDGTGKEEDEVGEMGMEEMGMEEMGMEERGKEQERAKEEGTRKEEEPRKEKKTEKVEKKDKEHTLKGVGSRQHADENSHYVKVREAKMVTLCDTGTQTGYQDRLASISMGGTRRDSLASWMASKDRKHSLADAIMSNAPPSVIDQETSIAASVINEEADRLCEEICNFMEFGYDLLDQEEKLLESQATKYLGEEGGVDDVPVLNELAQGHGHDTRATSDRRQSIFSDVLAASDLPPAPYSNAFPSRDRRQSIHSDALPTSRDRRQSIHSDALPTSRDRRQSIHSDALPLPTSRDRRQSIHSDALPTSRDRRQSIHSDALPTRNRRQSIHSDALPMRDRRQSIHTDALPARERQQSYFGDASPVLDRLQSLYDVIPVGDRMRKRSNILQLDLHRDGPMHEQHGIMAADRIGLLGTDALPEVEDKTIEDKKHEFLRRGQGVRKLSEDRIKKQFASMAQAAINIIKDTGDALQYQLNERLGHYEKFYELWKQTRKARRRSIRREPVAGKSVIQSEPERYVKSRGEEEEDETKDEETDIVLPLISKVESIETPIEQGFMMIGSSKKSKPQTPPPKIPPARKRGKPKVMTRQQQMMKQKALLERARIVETKGDTQILTVESSGHQNPKSPHRAPKEGQRKPAATTPNQAFNLPFIAQGLSKREEPTDNKTIIPRQLSTAENVQKSLSSWDKQGIQKYYSANDVPKNKSEIKTSFRSRKAKNKLPNLNISNLFGSF